MIPTVKERIQQIQHGIVPDGYKKVKSGIIPKDWKYEVLAPYLIQHHEVSEYSDQYPVLTSSRKGIFMQSDYYNKEIASEDNTGYNVVPRGFFTYRHMSDDEIFRFNINTIVDKGIVSTLYPVFTTTAEINDVFLREILNGGSDFHRHAILQKQGGSRTYMYFEKLRKLALPLPPIEEQTKIAEILTKEDKVIELKEKLLAEKQRQKKCLMQQLLTGRKRIPGFSEKWVNVKLGDVFAERVETNCQALALLSVTGTNGVVPRSTIETKDNSSEDKSKYLKICKGDIGYNTMRMWQGVSALSEYEGIVSPAYTILIPSETISAKYFSYLFKMHAVIFLFYRFSQGIVDDTRSLKYHEFAKLHLNVPSDKQEQEAIARILTVTDKEIEILQKDLDLEKQKKKALMQLLLTGIVRTN